MENKSDLLFASVTDRGLSEKRPQNEDSFAELPQFGVFAVADGVGGAQAGDFASQMAMELLTEAVSNSPEGADAEELFRIAIEHANLSIYQMAADVPQLSSMATTIVALHLSKNIATLAHVGDSRIYRFTPDGRGFRETNDHSVVEEEVRAGRMTPEEAAVHPSRNVISRALGAEGTVEIDFRIIMVEPGTTFMLCSDGITRHISDDELEAIFASNAQPQLICDHLRELCYSRGAEDNLTAVIVRTFAEAAEPIDDFDSTTPVMEEETVASARSAFAAPSGETQEIAIEDTLAEIDLTDVEITGHFVTPDAIEVIETDETPQIVEQIPAAAEIVEELPVVETARPTIETDSDEQYLLTETDVEVEPVLEEPQDLSSYTSSSVVVPAQTPATPEPEFAMFGSQTQTYAHADDHTPAGGGIGRILVSLGLLVLGAALAVGATYFLGFTGQDAAAVPPQIETMQSNNVPLTSFEELRRAVDNNPEAYLAKYAPSPEDASDFYLLGRANLVLGKGQQARQQFLLARENLTRVTDEKERKTLAYEISIALAAADSAATIEEFKKSVPSSAVPGDSNSPLR